LVIFKAILDKETCEDCGFEGKYVQHGMVVFCPKCYRRKGTLPDSTNNVKVGGLIIDRFN